MKTIAKEYIDLTKLWEETDKKVVIDNLERIFGDADTLKRNHDGTRINTLLAMTNTDKNTVRAWMNQSREKVKIPLLKLCMIAEGLNIDVRLLLSNRGDWRECKDIPGHLIIVFEKIRCNQYYKEDGWDIESFVKDIHEKEEYENMSIESKIEKLTNDCWIYFKVLVGINDSEIFDKILKTATIIHKEQGEC